MLRDLIEALFAPRELPPPMVIQVHDVALPSASAGFNFRFSCRVFSQQNRRGAEPHPSVYDVARHSVLQRASDVAANAELTHRDDVQNHLAAVLGGYQLELNGQLRVWADGVAVAVTDADLQAVRRKLDLDRELLDWRHKKEVERQERDFVAEMLRDPQQALAWWVSHNKQQVAQAVDMIEPLTRLSDTVHGRAKPQAGVSPEEQFLAAADVLFAPLDEWSRALLGNELAKTLDAFGQTSLADRLRERFDAPDPVT
ncbi:hypothetical protein [Kutzneria sp. NPDC052558]|uniref:hypothetical protein n=1 Tax=Kutzneria sp. NPDC052558 TaxID=3364121 RepID=UPI0037C596DC